MSYAEQVIAEVVTRFPDWQPTPTMLGFARAVAKALVERAPDMGDDLRVARKKLGLSQQQLADLLGVAPEHLSRIVHGKRTYTKTMRLAVCSLGAATPPSGYLLVPIEVLREVASKLQQIANARNSRSARSMAAAALDEFVDTLAAALKPSGDPS